MFGCSNSNARPLRRTTAFRRTWTTAKAAARCWEHPRIRPGWREAKSAQDYKRFMAVLQDFFSTAMDLTRAKRRDNDNVSVVHEKCWMNEFEMGMSQDVSVDDVCTSPSMPWYRH
jgi:Zn-dependent M32 family carboxypeptidase